MDSFISNFWEVFDKSIQDLNEKEKIINTPMIFNKSFKSFKMSELDLNTSATLQLQNYVFTNQYKVLSVE